MMMMMMMIAAVDVRSDRHRWWHRRRSIVFLKGGVRAVIVMVHVNGEFLVQSGSMKVVSVIRHGARARWQFPHIFARR